MTDERSALSVKQSAYRRFPSADPELPAAKSSQVRGDQRVQADNLPRNDSSNTSSFGVHEKHRPMWISEHMFDRPIAPLRSELVSR